MSYLTPPIIPSVEGGADPSTGDVLSFMGERTFNSPDKNIKWNTSVSVNNEAESYPSLFFQCYTVRADNPTLDWVAVSGTSVTPLYNAGVCANTLGGTPWYYFAFQYQVPANVDKIQTSMKFSASMDGFGGGDSIYGVFTSWKLRSETPEIKLRSSIGGITGASAGQDYTINVCVNVPASTNSVIWLVASRPASAGAIPLSVQDTIKITDNIPTRGNMFHLAETNADRTAFSVSSLPNVTASNNKEVAIFSWQVSCA